MDTGHMDTALAVAIVVPFAAAYVFALCFAIVNVAGTADLSGVKKLVWATGIIVAPLLAAIAWYVAGPRLSQVRLR